MKLVQIRENVLVNPEHISSIDVRGDYNDSAYVVYTLVMYNGNIYEIRLHGYYSQAYPWEYLAQSFPKLLEGTWLSRRS